MKIHVYKNTCKLDTNNTELLEALRFYFSALYPGVGYTRNYKRGWDGKKFFISPDGEFRIGLLDLITEALDTKTQVAYDVIYHEKEDTSLICPTTLGPYTLRDYQITAVEKVFEKQKVVIKSPTGSGKTLIMAQVVKLYPSNKMITILFNSKHLLLQTYKFFKNCGIEDVGICYGEGYEDGRIMLSTVQSIERIIEPYVEKSELMMVDEVHEFCNGKVTLAALHSFPNAKFKIGFTATPPRNKFSKLNLADAIGPNFEVKSAQELIEASSLTPPVIKLINFTYQDSEAQANWFDSYKNLYEKYVINNYSKLIFLEDEIMKIFKNNPKAKPLILVKSLDHLDRIQVVLSKIANLFVIEGKIDTTERYNLINEFLTTPNAILIGTKVLKTGVSIDEITHFFNLQELKSEISTIQALGRALRLHDTKPEVYVYDFTTVNIRYLDDHRRKRKATYKREGYKIQEIEYNENP